jgi:hypothetical protein
MNRFSSALVSALLFAGGAQAADSRRNHAERVQDRHELRQDRRELRDDRRDLQELEAVLMRFDNAWARRNAREMAEVEDTLHRLLRAELAESRAELSADVREARRSRREVRAGQWEARNDVAWGWSGAHANDRRDRRDDRRDARDDRRDVRAEAVALRTRQVIARELEELEGLRQGGALHRKRALIVELIQLGQQELHQGRQELREDRRELREDRRTQQPLRQDWRRI